MWLGRPLATTSNLTAVFPNGVAQGGRVLVEEPDCSYKPLTDIICSHNSGIRTRGQGAPCEIMHADLHYALI